MGIFMHACTLYNPTIVPRIATPPISETLSRSQLSCGGRLVVKPHRPVLPHKDLYTKLFFYYHSIEPRQRRLWIRNCSSSASSASSGSCPASCHLCPYRLCRLQALPE